MPFSLRKDTKLLIYLSGLRKLTKVEQLDQSFNSELVSTFTHRSLIDQFREKVPVCLPRQIDGIIGNRVRITNCRATVIPTFRKLGKSDTALFLTCQPWLAVLTMLSRFEAIRQGFYGFFF